LKFIEWGVILIIPLFLICGCKSSNPSIIIESDCAAPCWREIRPGETTQEELLTSINEMPDVKPASVKVHGQPWKIFTDIIEFEMLTNEEVEIYMLDDKVAEITFSGKNLATFEQSVEKFGEPDYIINIQSFGPGILFTEAQHNFIMALKPEKGVMYGYDTYYIPKSQRPEIKPDIKIRWIDFFDANSYKELLDAKMFSMGMLDGTETVKRFQPWVGYGSLQEKYPLVK